MSKEDAVENLFRGVERAHRAEDVDASLSFFDPDSVWVTGRGVCYRGRDAVIVDQTCSDRTGGPRDERARHTHTYVVSLHTEQPRIVAGQNTVRTVE